MSNIERTFFQCLTTLLLALSNAYWSDTAAAQDVYKLTERLRYCEQDLRQCGERVARLNQDGNNVHKQLKNCTRALADRDQNSQDCSRPISEYRDKLAKKRVRSQQRHSDYDDKSDPTPPLGMPDRPGEQQWLGDINKQLRGIAYRAVSDRDHAELQKLEDAQCRKGDIKCTIEFRTNVISLAIPLQ